MYSNKTLAEVLYGLSIAGIALFGIIIGYFLVMAMLALLGILPKYHDISLEVPVSLQETQTYFQPESQDDQFIAKGLHIQKAHIEAKPVDRIYLQSLGYFHASLYVGFFVGILYFLARILKHVKSGHPFHVQNSSFIRAMGLLSLGLGVYEFMILLFTSQYFHDKFTLSHGSTLAYPSVWDFNVVAIFLGLVLLVLSRTFALGSDLQDLENQTV